MKLKLVDQIKEMENHYFHSMENYHTVLSEKFKEIDQDKVYPVDEMKIFFANNLELYDTGWLVGYMTVINTFRHSFNIKGRIYLFLKMTIFLIGCMIGNFLKNKNINQYKKGWIGGYLEAIGVLKKCVNQIN